MNWLSEGCSITVTPPGGGAPIEVATIQGFECLVRIALNFAVRLAGIAAFVMLLIGGFKYLTSGGDPKSTESAKKTITYAILGLVLLLGGWLVLLFIKEFTGINVTIFEIPK
jgi:TRAP-type C4-dicarboxylate transport system permease small subunit